MKTNEAPEKLYLLQHNGLVCYCMSNEDDIEYTRTDAFIDKACEWLLKNDSYAKPTELLVRDFKKAMEDKL